MELFEQNAPRIATDPFFLAATRPAPGQPEKNYALFEKGPNGETLFRYSGEHKRSFKTYIFPAPDLVPGHGWIGGPNSSLDLFLRIQASHTVDTPMTVKSGGATALYSRRPLFVLFHRSLQPRRRSLCISIYEQQSRLIRRYLSNESPCQRDVHELPHIDALCWRLRHARLQRFRYLEQGSTQFDAAVCDNCDLSAPDAPYAGIIVYQEPDAKSDVVLSSANNRPPYKPVP